MNTTFFRKFIDFNYLLGIAILLFSMPVFNVGMSIGGFWVSGAFILDFILRYAQGTLPVGQMMSKLKGPAGWLIALYLLHVLGMIYTEDWSYGIHDLKIKLPLFVFPISLLLLEMRKSIYIKMMYFLILGLLFSTSTNLLVLQGIIDIPFSDVREITTSFITRVALIRLGMMIALGIAFLVYYIPKNRIIALIHVLIIGYLFYFLIAFGNVTGLILSTVTLGFGIVYQCWKLVPRKRRSLVGAIAALTIVIPLAVLTQWTYQAIQTETIDPSSLAYFSAGGERYTHMIDQPQKENGNFVWTYIAWNELEDTWHTRSKTPFWGKDAKGQDTYATLIRYLASRGFRKDAEGVKSLSENDIERIEKGIPSYLENPKHGLKKRIEEFAFELNIYHSGGNPSGNSLTQRFEFWKAATHIHNQHPWMGIGTGDIDGAYASAYEEIESQLKPQFQLRAHNQYLTILATFGWLGFVWFLLAIFAPILQGSPAALDRITYPFLLIMLLSFAMEDTLETQAGVTLFAFFISFFLIVKPTE